MSAIHAVPSEHKQRSSLVTWCTRLVRGFRYRLRLDPNQASGMVAQLINVGELAPAIEACRRAIGVNPHNVHAYLHMIDLCGRRFRDLRHAALCYQRGLAQITDPNDRELLESFYLYTHLFNRQR